MGMRGSAFRPRRSSRARRGRAIPVAAVAALSLVMLAVPASAAPAQAQPAPPRLTATPLTPSSQAQGAKSASSRLARTDRSLLGLRSTAPVHVLVKLDYDSLAAYAGQLKGLPATSPSVTHRGLSLRSDAARRYQGFVQGVEQRFVDALGVRVSAARAGARLRTTYGGVAVTLPSNQVAELLKLPGVIAVQRDALAKPLTDSSPAFIGAPTIDNQLTPANDPFVCQRKLISGQPFLATYNAVLGDEPYPSSARDSDGHGTHTSTTAAGGPVAHANPLGIDRGAIHGIAPGAHVAVYKVCGTQGCFQSDTVQAVGQAILDGVNVINFSISGGVDPYTDAVELTFLDAYAAGITVSASAGNDGPGAGTVNHNSPWVLTIAASTQTRTFRSTITLNGGGATLQVSGATITAGIANPAQVVRASDPPYADPLCVKPVPPGTFTGKIVACERGPNRALKSFNVSQGGAVGMILYNAFPFDVFTDNHWIPTVHIDKPETDQLLAFLTAHPGATASWPQGTKTTWQGDRVTFFSSRGTGSDWVKPDITAPGLQILAGNTPTPNPAEPVLGPPGNLFQVIAGTSMSSPHAAGSAALVKALHPSWTPGQIKS